MHRVPASSPHYPHAAMASRSPAQAIQQNTSGPMTMMMMGHRQGPEMSNRSLQQSFQSLNPARAQQNQQGTYCESPRLLSSAQGAMGGAMMVRPAYSTPNNGPTGMNYMTPFSTPRRQIQDRGAYQSDPIRNQSHQPGFGQAPMGLI